MKRQQGFTVIEVLVAIAAFAVLAAGALSLLPGLFRINAQSQGDQSVTLTAKSFFEQARNAWSTQAAFDAPAALPAPVNPTGYACTASHAATVVAGAVAHVRRVTLECAPGYTGAQAYVTDYGRPQ